VGRARGPPLLLLRSFHDNCADRLRDLIDQATGGALRASAGVPYSRTLRELGRGLVGMRLLLLATTWWPAASSTSTRRCGRRCSPEILRSEVGLRLEAAPELLYRGAAGVPVRGLSGRLDFLGIAVAFWLPLFLARWRRRFETRRWCGDAAASRCSARWCGAGDRLARSPRCAQRGVAVVLPLDGALPLLPPAWRRRYARLRILGWRW